MALNYKSYNELRSKIGPELSPSLFLPDRREAVITVVMFIFYWTLFFLGTKFTAWIIPIGILLGFIAEFLSMANHDVLHGSVFRSKTTALIFCIPNSLITLISPSFWRYWHNFHHRSTDRWTVDKQPYEMGYETHGYPVLRRWLGPLELFIYKFIHLTRTQLKFIRDPRYTSRQSLKLKNTVMVELSLIFAFKIFLFFVLPFPLWLGLELLPLLIQGFLSSIFLVTQHSHKLDTRGGIRTFSVSLPKWLELWFLNAGYHVEHHLFPNLPSRNLPLLKEILLKKGVQPVTSYPLQEALLSIYKKD